MITIYNSNNNHVFFSNKNTIYIFEVLYEFFREHGYLLSYLNVRKYTDRNGNIISFSEILSPPIGIAYVKTTFVIEFIDTIMSFYKVESYGLCRKKITNFKKIRESIDKNKTGITLEEELEMYCKLITPFF